MAFILVKHSLRKGQPAEMHYIAESYRNHEGKIKHLILYKLKEAKTLDEARQKIEAERQPIIENLMEWRRELKKLKKGKALPGLPWVQRQKAENFIRWGMERLLAVEEKLAEIELLKLEYPSL
ncbi:MAG: hypothetical protein HY431_00690 [Candidatus Levybacteria bacterium]|nr:hypothetical protein [Candidatus Levybacteria bacterium]